MQLTQTIKAEKVGHRDFERMYEPGNGIDDLKRLRITRRRFKSVLVLMGVFSLCLVCHTAFRVEHGAYSFADLVAFGLLAMTYLLICIDQMSCLSTLSCQSIERLETMALLDDLTGVYNFAYMRYRLSEEITRAERNGRPLSVICIDLDNFKQVNDQYGHHAGNEVLRKVAQCLKSSQRASDLFGRLGGDEFLVILPDTPREEAVNAAYRLLRAVKSVFYEAPDGTLVDYIRLSAGITQYPDNGSDADSLLAQADREMYHAKRMGGNRIGTVEQKITSNVQV